MDLQFCTITRKGAITIVTLSRPEVYNALHTDAHFELHRVFNDCFEQDRPAALPADVGHGVKPSESTSQRA